MNVRMKIAFCYEQKQAAGGESVELVAADFGGAFHREPPNRHTKHCRRFQFTLATSALEGSLLTPSAP